MQHRRTCICDQTSPRSAAARPEFVDEAGDQGQLLPHRAEAEVRVLIDRKQLARSWPGTIGHALQSLLAMAWSRSSDQQSWDQCAGESRQLFEGGESHKLVCSMQPEHMERTALERKMLEWFVSTKPLSSDRFQLSATVS